MRPAVNNMGFRKISFDISWHNGESTLEAGIVKNCFLFNLNREANCVPRLAEQGADKYFLKTPSHYESRTVEPLQ